MATFLAGNAHHLQRVVDIVDRFQPGKQRLTVILEDVRGPRLADALAVVKNFASVHRHQAGDHVDECALAAPVRTEDRNEMSERQINSKIVVNRSVVEALPQAADCHQGLPFRRLRRRNLRRIARCNLAGPDRRDVALDVALGHVQFPNSALVSSLSRTLSGPTSTPSWIKTSTSAWYDLMSVSLRSLNPRR